MAEAERPVPLADIVRARLGRKPLLGDRIGLGDIELIVRGVRGDRITEVGIELDPRTRARPSLAQLRAWLRQSWRGCGAASDRGGKARRVARRSEPGAADRRTPRE